LIGNAHFLIVGIDKGKEGEGVPHAGAARQGKEEQEHEQGLRDTVYTGTMK
jgi:hypothetical protein